MKVIRAESAGFCRGVERAINIVRDYLRRGRVPVFTDGPLIHNRQMMAALKAEGVREVGDYCSRSELDLGLSPEERKNAVVVVRAHGVTPERREYLKTLGAEFRDATCPDVGVIAGRVRLFARKGFATLVFGDPDHPEVIGILGYAEGRGHAVRTAADLAALPPLGEKVCMVSQSTMFVDEFEVLAAEVKRLYPDAQIFNTICGATRARQHDVVRLAEQGAEAVVVIGGRHSANTVKLATLVERHGLPCYHVEMLRELDLEQMRRYRVVGVTAGASTPGFLIDEVCAALEKLDA
ncbi:MAG TPA: 4-hydroxy-3-methylbut-2-enyl diphosphate reductase [Candidatus Spyradosoma merdigallinarum]|uniref:4-hydroxy-3-methylbut-2-enyl diphosphate reductase n=1 Tax=Candidatus Spyradosoma merdigallinarum TaxID=2840950 RepID=A0A9D1NKR4_9BACT|nr:4-hydroxy-3-methylbut-2-enyl diphosphate reductase [Candidatus Spyradosoma merdigallinarum]